MFGMHIEGNLEIYDTVLYQEVFWLDVSVHYVEAMEVLDGARQVIQHAASILLRVLG